MRKLGWLFLLASVASAADQGPIRTEELAARMPADLGPAQVDVSAYPSAQQKNYALFQDRCSRCHTAARSLHSKIVTRADWHHFVSLMHGRLLSRSMSEPWKSSEARAIVDFLAYDSQIRKINGAKEFEALQTQLAERFTQVQAEKARRESAPATKPSAPYTGANP